MKRLLTILLCLIACQVVSAVKIQKGYVKTRGRLAANGSVIPGERVPGVVIILKDGVSAVTDKDGNFALNLAADDFFIKSVKKSGYEVSDPDIYHRRYAWSEHPFVIVLDSAQEQNIDRLTVEKQLRRALQRKLGEKESELEALKEEKRISDKEYRRKLQELYKFQETNEKFVPEMVERYSRIDFDELDDFQRCVATSIQNGELTRADSLLNAKGNLDDSQTEIDNLRDFDTLEEDLLSDFKKFFDIAKLEANSEKMVYALKGMGQLYLGRADYTSALTSYEKALEISIEAFGEDHPQTKDLREEIEKIKEKSSIAK